jgi:hypothetical protein
MGARPGGAGHLILRPLGAWPATALCMHFDPRVLGRLGCVQLLELACMTEIGRASCVHVVRACLRVRAHGEKHLLQNIEIR